MSDDDQELERLTITEAADRAGVARSTIRRALDRGRFPGAIRADNQARTWRIPVEELDQAGYRTRTSATEAPGASLSTPQGTPQAGPSVGALALLPELGPLLERVSNAERERADAQAAARIAEHRLETARERLAELEREAAKRGQTHWLVILVALLVGLAGILVALGVSALESDPNLRYLDGYSGAVLIDGVIRVLAVAAVAVVLYVVIAAWRQRRS